MFTGIIESLSTLIELKKDKNNTIFIFENELISELSIKQSLCHNGICLTIESIDLEINTYQVTAVAETLQKTNLKYNKIGDLFNIERCLSANGRFDGHIVQGHVDGLAQCVAKSDEGGSFKFTFKTFSKNGLIVDKGSITINGISLTVVRSQYNTFSVVIIPYTFKNTNFKTLKINDFVNIEFDIIGKYINRIMKDSTFDEVKKI